MDQVNSEHEAKCEELEGLKVRCRELEGRHGEKCRGNEELMIEGVDANKKLEVLSGEKDGLAARVEELEEQLLRQQSLLANHTACNPVDSTTRKSTGASHQKMEQLEAELSEVTELKNAEIDLLRKQLNRFESKAATAHLANVNEEQLNLQLDEKKKEHESTISGLKKEWGEERGSLREEIRRLNLEVSCLKAKCSEVGFKNNTEDEEEEWTSRYDGQRRRSNLDLKSSVDGNLPQSIQEEESSAATTPHSTTNTRDSDPTFGTNRSFGLDSSDISSLQSIISMLRQTIDQTNTEKESLEQRLTEEQTRSQLELRAFAKTLEGVDELRKSAEQMSREIRRIKVKGYKPTRSDLIGGLDVGVSSSLGGGVHNFGELSAAVEASESMEDAIRLIESQNDATEERRRMGVVKAVAATTTTMNPPNNTKAPYRRGLSNTTEDDDNEDSGFLSFWNNVADDDDEDDDDEEETAKEKKKKSSKSKRKSSKKSRCSSGGSVFTSLF